MNKTEKTEKIDKTKKTEKTEKIDKTKKTEKKVKIGETALDIYEEDKITKDLIELNNKEINNIKKEYIELKKVLKEKPNDLELNFELDELLNKYLKERENYFKHKLNLKMKQLKILENLLININLLKNKDYKMKIEQDSNDITNKINIIKEDINELENILK